MEYYIIILRQNPYSLNYWTLRENPFLEVEKLAYCNSDGLAIFNSKAYAEDEIRVYGIDGEVYQLPLL